MSTILENGVTIRHTPPKGRGVFAARAFRRGETVVTGAPVEVALERTTTSFQVDRDRHVELDEPARVINHACDPNTGLRDNALGGYDFVALTDIAADDEISWDYDTGEFISIAVSACHCRSPRCRGRTRGYQFLPPEVRARYGEFIAAYLKPARAL
jgi:hypothetical protein